MNKKRLVGVIVMWLLVVVGCNNHSNDTSSKEDDTSVWEILTDEQKNYFSDHLDYSKDAIDLMSYEAANWYLLGTGLELYNQSTGEEMFGIQYREEQEIASSSDSEKIISFQEVKNIRLKGKNIRLNDFVEYKYEVVKESDNEYTMKLPLSDYKETYVYICFSRDEKGFIDMNVPYICYMGGNPTRAFSILYEEDTMRAFFEDAPKCELDGKSFMGVQYSSVTDNSLVIYMRNWSDKKIKLSESYELYEITEDGEKLIASAEGEVSKLSEKSGCFRSVQLKENIKLIEGKRYLIKYGKNKKGYIYDELEFTR